MPDDEEGDQRLSVVGWMAGTTQPARWHLVLIWILILFCAGVHAATGEPLLHLFFGGG